MPRLIIQSGPRTGKELSFDASVVIGRGPTSDIPLDDPSVSRRHALLRWVDGHCSVLDLASANGTFVNGRRVSAPARLRDGDHLSVGTIAAVYRETSTAPVPTVDAGRWTDKTDGPKVQLTMSVDGSGIGKLDARESAAVVAAMSARLRFLNDLARISSQAFDEQALMRFVLDELLVLMPQADRAFIMQWDAAAGSLVPQAALTRSGRPDEIAYSRTLMEDVIGRRQAVLAINVEADERYSNAESMLAIGIRSVICAPMVLDNEVYGVIQVDSGSQEKRFGKAEMALLVGIATQVGLALAYARLHVKLLERELMERDLALARRIQLQFLPRGGPPISGYEFSVECRPAVSVGGDFYDFLELVDGMVGITVGDVAGKGVSAALYGARLITELRHQAAGQTQPAVILERLNRALTASDPDGMFVTLVLAVLDTRRSQLLIASAGHPLPFVRDGSNKVTELGGSGNVPLGVADDATFLQYRYELAPSDLVVMFSDGVTEAMNADKDLFGTERLVNSIRRASPKPDHVRDAILDDVKQFAGGAPQSDDITLLCFGPTRAPGR
jgi:phosphoserine phosphatase RsbU/P